MVSVGGVTEVGVKVEYEVSQRASVKRDMVQTLSSVLNEREVGISLNQSTRLPLLR